MLTRETALHSLADMASPPPGSHLADRRTTLTRAPVLFSATGGRTIGRVEVAPGYGGAALLAERIKRFARDYRTEAIALRFAHYGEQAPRALQRWVQENIEFRLEIGEVFAAPWITIAERYGDCDDHATLVAATLSALGFRTAIGFYDRDGEPTHVWPLVHDGRSWKHLETTVRAHYGEEPRAAAHRVGAARVDIRNGTLSHLGAMGFRDVVDADRVFVEGGDRVWLRLLVTKSLSTPALHGVLRANGLAEIELYQGKEMPVGIAPIEWAPDPLLVDTERSEHTRTIRAVATYVRPDSRVLSRRLDDGVIVLAAWALERETQIRGMGVVDTSTDLARAKALTSWLPDGFFVDLADVAKRRKMRAKDLLLVLHRESGLRGSAVNIQNGKKVAVGILQITSVAAPGVGLPTEESRLSVLNMGEREQLKLVDRYFANNERHRGGRPYPAAVHVYQAVFAPATMAQGDAMSLVLYRSPSAAYTQNVGVDPVVNGRRKGWIELGDMDRFLDASRKSATYLAALARLEAVTGGESGGLGLSGTQIAVALVGVGAAVAAAIAAARA